MNLEEAFNEWMRRYVEDPDGFEREWITVQRHMEETATGEDVTYGASCAAYLGRIMGGEIVDVSVTIKPVEVDLG